MLLPSTRYYLPRILVHLHLTREQKYHSIHKSGKKLEDVLTVEELRELRE